MRRLKGEKNARNKDGGTDRCGVVSGAVLTEFLAR